MPRFIPTYVGHTDLSLHGQIPRPVHPHIRGAYGHLDGKLPSVFGSSPHTWGIQAWPSEYSLLLRFIPTYVGHT